MRLGRFDVVMSQLETCDLDCGQVDELRRSPDRFTEGLERLLGSQACGGIALTGACTLSTSQGRRRIIGTAQACSAIIPVGSLTPKHVTAPDDAPGCDRADSLAPALVPGPEDRQGQKACLSHWLH